MTNTMTPELFWLAMTTAMTGFFWVPYIVNRVRELGPPPTSWYPLPDPPPRAPWAARAMRAHVNAIENMMIFAPLAIAVELAGSGTPMTGSACAIYFYARLAHYAIGIFGAPVPFRTLAFLIGFAAQAILAVNLLALT